ncbi:hypothetical protein BM1_09986 [Bipolaris maydis]|nr:hypothetical protein BM1_09986 [Bipolaris maydis]
MRGRNQLNRPINIADLQVLAQQEETREVTAEEIEKSLIPESLKQHKYSIKLWIEFSQQVLGTHVQEDKPFPQPPPANHIRLFLTWYTRTSNGLIDEKINDTTIANRLRCLKRAIRLFTNHIYSKADNSLFAQAVENELPRTESLSTKAYDKPLAPLNVSKDVIRFLWVCDEYQFQHPRARLQLAFSILMLTLMGMRPGEFIESSNWKDSNEGLLYRDVKLLRSSEADGGFMLHVQLRNRKGHRHNHKQGALMLLTEEPGDRALCPVTYFLALALADGVFEGCKTLSDLQSRKPSPGSSYCEFPYHADLGNLPVLRCCQPDGSISPTRILTYYGFHWMIRSLGQRAGYKDKLTSYCFRRGYGNAIDKIVTAAQRQQLMGHANPNIFQTYISSMIGIDSQSVVLGRDQRMDLINNHSSMMLHRNLLAPMPPGSQLAETSSLNTCHHDSDLPYDKRKYLQRTTFEEERQQFFQCRSTATSSTSSDGTRTPSRYLKALLKFEVGRYQAVMLMYPDLKSDGDEHDKDNETLDHESCETAEMTTSTHHCVTLEQIVHPLQSIANAHKQNFEYEGAETIENGCCSFCKKTLDGYTNCILENVEIGRTSISSFAQGSGD